MAIWVSLNKTDDCLVNALACIANARVTLLIEMVAGLTQ
ncbi:hypothetical protein COO91_05844 [Nostoc flagelliforme CCNUN1]|uniref:Uncharacterized protein n=1 Tax=Nostoc flagelliforme CCNUN1 TaxID=2038116 RepID=A0A2K8SWP1_9NOSO|nr:hypothetical protein COO91_05844 [Nostoc flagelliforme CCNUN1]